MVKVELTLDEYEAIEELVSEFSEFLNNKVLENSLFDKFNYKLYKKYREQIK